MTRVLVCGGRDFNDRELVFAELDRLNERSAILCIIEGGARGADYLAAQWSAKRELSEHARFSADWALYGKAAGPIRNQRMLDEGKPDLVVAFPGGTGTADMVRRATAAGIEIIEVLRPTGR